MGPLKGLRVLEVGGIGPSPFCGMMLADMGADVIRIDRTGGGDIGATQFGGPEFAIPHRGKSALAINLKAVGGPQVLMRLAVQADVLVEGHRPGVMERLGLGPGDISPRNPRLIYARMTGWGQDGPLAQTAGHDINYIALSGVLDAIGPKGGAPVPPLSLIGDYAGGGMLCAFGIVSALWERERSGLGQTVDAAMIDGAAILLADCFGGLEAGWFKTERGSNMLDGGAPFYGSYETLDGFYVAIGPVEPQFYDILVTALELPRALLDEQLNRERWPEMRARVSDRIRRLTRAELETMFAGTDGCFAPILSVRDAPNHPHAIARESFYRAGGVVQPRPAPRFSRTSPTTPAPAVTPGIDTHAILSAFGFTKTEIAALAKTGVID